MCGIHWYHKGRGTPTHSYVFFLPHAAFFSFLTIWAAYSNMQNLWLLKQKTWLSLSSLWKRPSALQRSYRLSQQSPLKSGSGDYSVHGWLSWWQRYSGFFSSGNKLNNCHFTKPVLLGDGSFLPTVNGIRVISFAKDAKADCIKRLQRWECCFAFIWDFVGNLNGLSFSTVKWHMNMRHSFVWIKTCAATVILDGTLWHIHPNHTHKRTHARTQAHMQVHKKMK